MGNYPGDGGAIRPEGDQANPGLMASLAAEFRAGHPVHEEHANAIPRPVRCREVVIPCLVDNVGLRPKWHLLDDLLQVTEVEFDIRPRTKQAAGVLKDVPGMGFCPALWLYVSSVPERHDHEVGRDMNRHCIESE